MPAKRALPVRFHPAVEGWFAATFPAPTVAQEKGWPAIQAGKHTLVFAPTGSGKTLAAFLAAIDRLMFSPVPDKRDRCRVLYVSPLRALAVDVERNLRAPLAGIARAAQSRGDTFHTPVIGLRTGDTPADERARMVRQPPDILITTPESLFLVLTSQARSMLPPVELVIVDEIHTMVGSKRGAHLALSLERLQELARRPFQRVGLSATQRPLDEVARYLGGGEAGHTWRARPVEVVDAGARKALDLRVEVPVEDMADSRGRTVEPQSVEGPAAAAAPGHSIWPAIHPRLLELIRAHRSTLLFVNSRRLAERLAAALNDLAGEELARAHHGSLSREQRLQVEDDLKAGRLPAMVATSSLELGIDMGAIDLVIQIEAPPSVASGLQRIGRGGHQAGAVSRGVIFPKYRGDLLATAAITRAMHQGLVEETRVPLNPLDVLAQQVVAIAASGEQAVEGLFALVRRAAPFAKLPRAQLEGVLDMLSGRYPSDEFAELRPRLVWDRLKGTVRAREGAARLAVTNAGTIPDRGLYGVFLADGDGAEARPPTATGARPAGRRVGELDEEMVFESREGEVFVLGASSWRIVQIERDRVLVVPAPGEPGKMPFWKGDRPPRPVELGRAVGRLTRELAASPREEALRRLVEEHDLDPGAAENLLAYVADQKAATGVLPDDRTLVLERTRDEMGDWRLCLLSPWGGRVHAPWALVLRARLRASLDVDVETVWSDDGIVIRVPDREEPPTGSLLLPDPEQVEDLVVRELGGSALFAAHFREAAARALLLPRRRPGLRSPLWMQRKRAADLLKVASRYGSFPIILETYRECLQDVFDLPALVALASGLRRREIRVTTVDTDRPSPFSASLLFGYVANYLYEGDAPLAERKAQALSVDQAQLRELLGQAELRELLDAQVMDELEARLQGLDEAHKARSPDRVHELLLRVGDLGPDELRARVGPPQRGAPARAAASAAPTGPDVDALASAWTHELLRDGRIVRVRLAGDERLAAAEDAGKLRDAFGAPPPPGLPQAFLEPAPRALRDVVSRYARTHAPFAVEEVARRYALGEGPVEAALEELAHEGRVLEGAFRPGGSGREWCDADVLATLRRRSLARLRKQVEPVEPAALARLAHDWQGIATGPRPSVRRGPDALLDVVEQLQGAAVPASVLETEVLPARLPGYRSEDLDALCAAGEVVWAGVGPLGERDGRVALYLADALPLLHAPRPDAPAGEGHEALRAHLGRHGASFFAELAAAVPGTLPSVVLEALWDLVWAGEVTNDTPGALRAFLRGTSPSSSRRMGRGAAFRSRRQSPPSAVGRWSRLPRPAVGKAIETARAKAVAEQLLARHGVLTRPSVMAEGVAGGFAALYPVLKALEEAGRIRRGYFVAGLGGSQFAQPGALDRLRALREGAGDEEDVTPAAVLAATDPANPYGAALAWPEAVSGRAMRAAGVHVAIVDGVLAAVLVRGGAEILPVLPDSEPARGRVARGLAAALARWALRTGRTSLGWGGSGRDADRAVLAEALRAVGFVPWGPGFRLSSTPPPPALGMAVPPPVGAEESRADAQHDAGADEG